MRETSASESLEKHRKRIQMTSKPGPLPSPGKSMAETYLLAMRCPVLRRRDSLIRVFCTELENLDVMAREKVQAAKTARPKVPMRRPGADCLVVVMKRGNAGGAKRACHRR